MPEISSLLSPPDVRAAIDISLKAADLPDSIIELNQYGGAAIAEINQRVPNAASIEDSIKALHLGNAVNLLAAALLVPAVPMLVRQQTAEGDSYQRQEMDVDALVARLKARVDQEIDLVVPPESGSTIPVFFTRARGRRGR